MILDIDIYVVARCSIVDAHCNVILDIYAKPDTPVADYRTRFSGITKSDMKRALSTDEARRRIIGVLRVGFVGNLMLYSYRRWVY